MVISSLKEYREKTREYARKYYHSRKNDPEFRAKEIERLREYRLRLKHGKKKKKQATL